MKKLQPLATDVQAALAILVEDDVVTCTFTVKENGDKGTPRYNLKWHFDYADVTRPELLKIAMRSHRIDGQADWRKAKDRMDSEVWQGKVWSVRAMLDSTRQKATPAQKMDKLADTMTRVEREAAIAKMIELNRKS